MQIMAASLERAGDFFLHAGYGSAPAYPDIDPHVFSICLMGVVMVFLLVLFIHARASLRD